MVARYDPTHPENDGVDAEMEMTINGDWVTYDDYLELDEENNRLQAQIEELEEKLDDIRRIVR